MLWQVLANLIASDDGDDDQVAAFSRAVERDAFAVGRLGELLDGGVTSAEAELELRRDVLAALGEWLRA